MLKRVADRTLGRIFLFTIINLTKVTKHSKLLKVQIQKDYNLNVRHIFLNNRSANTDSHSFKMCTTYL